MSGHSGHRDGLLFTQKLSLNTWWGVITPLNVIAISLTIFRLYQRSSKRQLWWDDCMAFISLLFGIVYMSTPYFRREDTIPPPLTASQLHRRIVVWWLSTIFFPLVVWTARISIGLSIVRLVPLRSRCRYFLWVLNVSFLGAMLALVLYRVGKCAPTTWWHRGRIVHCYGGYQYSFVMLAADLTSDSCLVLAPFFMLRRSGLSKSHRRLIRAIFASSLLSSIAGIVSAMFMFKVRRQQFTWGWVIQFTSNIKAAVTLSVCNFLVVVTFIYRKLRSHDDEEAASVSVASEIERSKIETREQPRASHLPSSWNGTDYDRTTSLQTDSFQNMSTIFETRPPRDANEDETPPELHSPDPRTI